MNRFFGWDKVVDYFMGSVSPYPIAVFRILFGLCVCATLLLLHSDWLAWFGPHGWIGVETIGKAESGFRFNLFACIPQDDLWIEGLYWGLLIASITLTIGFATRLSSLAVFLGMNSINQRMPLILHGGDAFLRNAAFFLLFASSSAVLSVDAELQKSRRSAGRSCVPQVAAWPQRLIQYQLAVVYLASFWWKAKGSAWRDGSALYYVINLREIQQFALPRFLHETWVVHLGTWLTMLFELAFPLLVWFRSCRRWVLITGIAFHLCLEYALNIPMFQWDMLAAYVLFVDPTRLQKSIVAARSFVHHTLAHKLAIPRLSDPRAGVKAGQVK
jgi:hypothetical protein